MPALLAMYAAPFIPAWTGSPDGNLRPFSAEICLIITIVAVLITPFFARKPNIPCALVSLAGLCAALLALLVSDASTAGVQFRGFLVSDPVSFLWKAMLLIFVIGIILMWFSTTASNMHEGDGPEFFTLLLGATLGMAVMSSTGNLLMLLMAVEMASLPSYVLAGFRKTHRIGAEASLKYVLFGAATSAIMAYGLSMLYGLYGTLQLSELATQMAHGTGGGALLAVAVFGIIVGIGFKLSAVPFHFWCPDVFEGASVEVSAFLSVASKGAALVLLLRVLLTFAEAFNYAPAPALTAIAVTIGIIGSITATVGNTAAFVQNNLKRLLAYSSIAHAGYMLCAASLLFRHGAESTPRDATQSILLYLAVYLFMNLGAFTIAGLVAKQSGSEGLAAFKGLGRRSPILAACMFAFMLSLVGLPPFAGFVAKVNILWVLMKDGGWWWALVVVIGINTILSLYYYLRVIRAMYLESSDEPSFFPNPLGAFVAVGSALALFVLFIGYNPLTRLTNHYSRLTTGVVAPADLAVRPTTMPAVAAPATRPVAAVLP